MRRCIMIEIERMAERKIDKVYSKLKNKYGNLVKLYNEYDEQELCIYALDLFEYSSWEQITAQIKSKYLKQ